MSLTRVDRILAALHLPIARRRGRRAWAHCPFHAWTSQAPTFFVRTSGERVGNFHCFACKVKGALPALVMHIRDCDFNEAKDFIREAGKGFEAPRAHARIKTREPILSRRKFQIPTEVIFEPFEEWISGPQRYLTERMIGAAQVELYGIGYAVEGALEGRVVFPVRIAGGEPVGYSARTFVDAIPKYKTPHETEHADFESMFGEHLWPPLESRDVIAVTEGAIDAISVKLALPELVTSALGGSDVRSGHVISLSTFEHVLIATDDDPPGDKAARSLASCLGRNTQTTRIALPKDANAMLLKRPNALRNYFRRALVQRAS